MTQMHSTLPEARSSAPKVLTRPYYERLHALELVHGWSRGMLAYTSALVAPVLASGESPRVLDLGCGTGGMLTWLNGFDGTHVAGIDLSRDALEFCQARGYGRLAEGSATTLPFAAESFDLVFCADVLQHLPRSGDTAALCEAARLLRPGGYLFLRTNSGCAERRVDAQSYRRYTRSDLIHRVAEAGLDVERVSYANALPAVPMLLRRLATRAMSRPAASDNYGHQREHHDHHHKSADPGLGRTLRPPALRWIDSVLSLVLHAEAAAVGRLGVNMPFGGSLVLLARKAESV